MYRKVMSDKTTFINNNYYNLFSSFLNFIKMMVMIDR